MSVRIGLDDRHTDALALKGMLLQRAIVVQDGVKVDFRPDWSMLLKEALEVN